MDRFRSSRGPVPDALGRIRSPARASDIQVYCSCGRWTAYTRYCAHCGTRIVTTAGEQTTMEGTGS